MDLAIRISNHGLSSNSNRPLATFFTVVEAVLKKTSRRFRESSSSTSSEKYCWQAQESGKNILSLSLYCLGGARWEVYCRSIHPSISGWNFPFSFGLWIGVGVVCILSLSSFAVSVDVFCVPLSITSSPRSDRTTARNAARAKKP